MCGLVAILSLAGSAPDAAMLERMAQAIRHRGPDDAGLTVEGPVGLAFRRLSILDLSIEAHQPMVAPDAPVSIVFNGEIYNYVELRTELVKLGHRFRSSGDTEVLLRAYLQWGRDCLSRLAGMWAFVIDDRRDGTLFGARDRFGIKPLFRHRTSSEWMFASEIKAILASGRVPVRANRARAAEFLLDCRLDETEQTFFEGIEQVPAAHAFTIDRDGHFRQWPYWRIEHGASARAHAPKDAAAAFAAVFETAVREHLRSDVPVAIHLSGGLDSTAIACAAARWRAGDASPPTVFCYEDPAYSEQAYIDATLAQTQATRVSTRCTPRELWDALPRVLRAHDEPFHTLVPLVGYELMRLTAQHGIKVVLNGQGADETLGGYGSYFPAAWASLWQEGAWRTLWSQLRDHAAVHGGQPRALLSSLLQQQVRAALQHLAPYRAASRSRWRQAAQRHAWVNPALGAWAEPPRPAEGTDLDTTLAHSVRQEPLPLYLRVEDRNSSAHSIEARVPFLDHRLVELAFSLAPQWRLDGGLNKAVLREAMRGRIPEVVRARVDKMGFPVAATAWMRGELYETVREVLHDPGFARVEGIRAHALQAMLEAHRRGEADHSLPIFRAVEWYHWCEQHRPAFV